MNENINRDEDAHCSFAEMIYRRNGADFAVEAEIQRAVEAIKEEERERQEENDRREREERLEMEDMRVRNAWWEFRDPGIDEPRWGEDDDDWRDDERDEEDENINENEPVGPVLDAIGFVFEKLVTQELFDEICSRIPVNCERMGKGDEKQEALIRTFTGRFAQHPIYEDTCVNCCVDDNPWVTCSSRRKTICEGRHTIPTCTFCCDKQTCGLLPPCDSPLDEDVCEKCKAVDAISPKWMQLQYASFGTFHNGFHGIDLLVDDDPFKICADQCVLCDERDTEKIGFAWFPRSVIDSDMRTVHAPLKAVMCGGCYIKYHTSPIGREITIAETGHNGNWAGAAAILFRSYVYEYQRSVEGLFLCINFITGWGNGISLPNEIILKIFGYTWEGYFYERRRDIKREREEEEVLRKIAKFNLEMAYIRHQRSLGNDIKLEELDPAIWEPGVEK